MSRCLLKIYLFAQKGAPQTTSCGSWWRLQDQGDLRWLKTYQKWCGPKSTVKFGQDR